MNRIFLSIIVSCFALNAFSQIPRTLTFQGHLTNATDEAIDGTRDFEFSLYESPNSGSKIWFEPHTAVQIKKGLYFVVLGGNGSPLDILPFDKPYYLEIKITSNNEILSPRLALTSSAYSISSINAANITSGTVDNARLDTDLQDLADGSLTGTKVIPDFGAQNISTTGSLTAASLSGTLPTSNLTGTIPVANGGTGGTSQPTARSGLGLGTLAVLNTITSSEITDLSIAAADLSDGSVTASKLASTAVTAGSYGNSNQVGAFTVDAQGRVTAASNVTITGAAPTGLAGGDLTGNFPNPIIGSGAITSSKLAASSVSGGTGGVILDNTIVNDDIFVTAAIADTKLATISTSGKVLNSATTATNANTSNTIVARDASGNFSAGTITANLSGNASTVTTNANLTGDVTSTGNATAIAAGAIVNADINGSAAISDTKLATISSSGKVLNSATTATNVNTASAIVARDAGGNFSAGTITATLSGNASTVTTNANLTGDVTSIGNATTIATGVIMNADINGSAAIAGSKINPDFGAQNILTTGSLTAASLSGALSASNLTGTNNLPNAVLDSDLQDLAADGVITNLNVSGTASIATSLSGIAIGNNNSAEGDYSLALGSYSRLSSTGDGSVFLGDRSVAVQTSGTAINRFYARFDNGYFFYTNAALTANVFVGSGGTSWTTVSDSTKKENFRTVNGEDILSKIGGMKLGTWNYKFNNSSLRHYGPFAQEFFSLFGKDEIGYISADTAINSQDISGLNMTAIQALVKRTDALLISLSKLEDELEKKDTEINVLKKFIDSHYSIDLSNKERSRKKSKRKQESEPTYSSITVNKN